MELEHVIEISKHGNEFWPFYGSIVEREKTTTWSWDFKKFISISHRLTKENIDEYNAGMRESYAIYAGKDRSSYVNAEVGKEVSHFGSWDAILKRAIEQFRELYGNTPVLVKTLVPDPGDTYGFGDYLKFMAKVLDGDYVFNVDDWTETFCDDCEEPTNECLCYLCEECGYEETLNRHDVCDDCAEKHEKEENAL